MDRISEKIIRYISDKSKNQALLLSGPWGIGKTYYIKNTLQRDLERHNVYRNCKIIYISLFGIYSLEEMQRVLGTKLIEAGCIKKDLLSQGKYSLSFIINQFKSIGLSAGGIVNIDIRVSDIVNLEKLIDYSDVVLVFDDLERCSSIDLQDLIGFINNLTEHKNVPVIISANGVELAKIKNYNDIKEKSIFREIVFECNLFDIYSTLVKELKFEREVTLFMMEQFKICIKQDDDFNLRDLKFFISNWSCLFNIIRGIINPSKTYYFDILGELYNYLFLRSIQYKRGIIRTDWGQSSQYGSIIINPQAKSPESLYPSLIMGFKFIDDYVYGFSLNIKDIEQGLEEVIYKYENACLVLFSLKDYYKFSEKEVLCLLGKLLFELMNHKYSQKDIKEILIILVQIRYSCKILFDIEFFVGCLSELIINDEGLLSYHLKDVTHRIDKEVKEQYDNYSERLIAIIKEKTFDIDIKELYLKDKFYNPDISPESIKDFIVKYRERYSQQLSFMMLLGGVDSVCEMIRDFDNQKLIALYSVFQWLYGYTPRREVIENDKESLSQLIGCINYEKSNPNCDKIRLQNLVYLKKVLESIINDYL